MTQLLPHLQPEPLRAGEIGDALTRLVQGLHFTGISLTQATAAFEKRYIECVLQECRGNKCKAARWLGMHRNTLDRHIERHNIEYWKFNAPGRYATRPKRKQLYASKERAAILGGDHSRRSALAPSSGRPLPVFDEEGGRGESSEPSRGGAAHLALDRMPPRVDSFDLDDVECGGLKA